MGIRIEDTDIYVTNTVDLFGHSQEVTEQGYAVNISYGFFNGCPMIVTDIKTENGCTYLRLRDDLGAEQENEEPRFWTCHINQVRKVK